jgi:class 3 adenylate cyclase
MFKDKKTGIHFYIEIKNLNEIIKAEREKIDKELKRTLHGLNTYFYGISLLVNKFGGKIEKISAGRIHVIFEETEDKFDFEKILEFATSCYLFNKEFNSFPKYNSYINFQINTGADYGSYYEYDIEDHINDDKEFITIGSVANVAAKIQSHGKANNFMITKNLFKHFDKSIKDKFEEYDDENLLKKLRIKKIYKVELNNIFENSKKEDIENSLETIFLKTKEESNKNNITDIKLENLRSKLIFEELSLKSKNKNFYSGVLCADINGFTKKFFDNDSNLDEMYKIMKEIFDLMKETINEFSGTKVQYQGDRIVAVFYDYTDKEDFVIRLLEASLKLNSKIKEKSEEIKNNPFIKGNDISVSIGASINDLIATRLGRKRYKDNIILGYAYEKADKAESVYAKENQIVVSKEIIEYLDDKEGDKFKIFRKYFKPINNTGYYETKNDFKDYRKDKNNLLNDFKYQIRDSKVKISGNPLKKNNKI